MFDFGRGDRAGMVNVWQRFLGTAGYDIGSSGVDGLFGNDTVLATRAFQAASGLGATDRVDQSTWAAARAAARPPVIPGGFSNALIDWYRITPFMRAHTSSGDYLERREHWIKMYDHCIRAFSDPADRETAIDTMRHYYGLMTRYDFGPTVPGHTTVHPEMERRLDAARALVEDRGGLSQALASITSQGGFVIRKITGGTGLSNHSFGTAVDLSATRNVFIYRDSARSPGADFPQEEFVFLTGVDPFGDELTGLLGSSRDQHYDAVLPTIQRHCDASRAFAAAFESTDTLEAAFRAAAASLGASFSRAESLDLLGLGSGTSLAALRGRLGASLWMKISRFARLLSTLLQRAEAAADSQAVTDDPGYIARHGWVNLSAELIAALMAKDGGRLRWIGAGRSRKDAMHFEIFPDEAERLRL